MKHRHKPDVGIRWVWGSTQTVDALTNTMRSTYLLTGSVFGSIQFGGDGSLPALSPPQPSPVAAELLPRVQAADGSVTIDIALSIPSFYITGDMRTGDYIPIGRAFAEYFGGTIPLVPATMNVTTLSFTADPIGQVYTGQAKILFGTPEDPLPEQAWTIMQVGTVGISVERLEMWVEARGGRIGGGIAGVFFLKGAGATAYDSPRLQLSAERPADGEDAANGWFFAANLFPGTSIDLTQMVARFIMGDPNYQWPARPTHWPARCRRGRRPTIRPATAAAGCSTSCCTRAWSRAHGRFSPAISSMRCGRRDRACGRAARACRGHPPGHASRRGPAIRPTLRPGQRNRGRRAAGGPGARSGVRRRRARGSCRR